MPTIKYLGGLYTGEIKNNKPHGKGYIIWEHGSTYDGEWKNGKFHGKGIFTLCKYLPDTYSKHIFIEKYIGEYKEGKRHGKGTLIGYDEEVTEGIFENNKLVKKVEQEQN